MPAGELSPEVRRSGHEVYHPPPFNAEDKKQERYTYTSPLLLSNSIKIHYIISKTKRADNNVEGHVFVFVPVLVLPTSQATSSSDHS
jgi:hypothetical protein